MTFILQGNCAQEIINGFSAKHGLRAIGAIDGSHIYCRPPTEYQENYVNRKGFHSITLPAVCDYKMFITDALVG